jgi:proline iminopeptidase
MARHRVSAYASPEVVSLVLATTSASIPQCVAEAARLTAALPPLLTPCSAMRRRAIATIPPLKSPCGHCTSAICAGLPPGPGPLRRSARNLTGNVVYETMASPYECIMLGNWHDWDRIKRRGEMTVPTFITVGQYGEITPTCAETMQRRLPQAQLQVFEQSSHMAHVEETERYLRVIAAFLTQVEAGQAYHEGHGG